MTYFPFISGTWIGSDEGWPLGYVILDFTAESTPGTPVALSGFKSCSLSQNFSLQLQREVMVILRRKRSTKIPPSPLTFTKMLLKRAIIDRFFQIFDILVNNLLPCQKCKKIWNRSIFGSSRGRNAFKSGKILGVSPLFSTWWPLWWPMSPYIPLHTPNTFPRTCGSTDQNILDPFWVVRRVWRVPKITIFQVFVNFLSGVTPRRALWPTITHTHTWYMLCDMLEH